MEEDVMKKSFVWCLMVVFLLVPCMAIGASDFPKGPITYVIPFNPGGQSDVEARMQQPYLEKIFGVKIIVEYKPGAGGALAWTQFAKAKPDGYTVCGINIPHIILQPLSQKDAAFKTEDLKPLCIFESTPIGLAVKKGSKINTLKEFIDYAKANPGKITVGISGKLTGHHMASLQFEKRAGIKLTLVTFTGAAPQTTALLGGHIEAVWGNSSDLVSYQNDIKILAIGTEKRMDTLPDVPTFQELGMKFYPRIDRGVAVPKDTPAHIAATLEKAFLDTVQKKEYNDKITKAGFVAMGLNSKESMKYIAEEIEENTKLLAEHDLLLKK
jgi:tripartite-type tricarboxylate transporter receptor subunit TctC